VALDGLVGTATVTTQGPHRRLRHDAKGGDFYLAASGDLDLATSGDSFMATDIQHPQDGHGQGLGGGLVAGADQMQNAMTT